MFSLNTIHSYREPRQLRNLQQSRHVAALPTQTCTTWDRSLQMSQAVKSLEDALDARISARRTLERRGAELQICEVHRTCDSHMTRHMTHHSIRRDKNLVTRRGRTAGAEAEGVRPAL